VSGIGWRSALRLIAALPALRPLSSAATATAATARALAILPLFAGGFTLAVDASAKSFGRRIFVAEFEIVVRRRPFTANRFVARTPVVSIAVSTAATLAPTALTSFALASFTLNTITLTALTLTALTLSALALNTIAPITPAATTTTATASSPASRAVITISTSFFAPLAVAIVSAAVARFCRRRFIFRKRLVEVFIFTPAAAHIIGVPRLALFEIIFIASFRLLGFGRASLRRPAEQFSHRIFFLDRLLGLGRNFNAQIAGKRHPVRSSFFRLWRSGWRIRSWSGRCHGGWRRWWRRGGVWIHAQFRGQ
jgi:hypothetical protein